MTEYSHGALSEVSRKVIPESSLSLKPVVELRPPIIVVSQIVPPPSVSVTVFNFGGGVRINPPARSMTISKADTVATLETNLRNHLSLKATGQIRCYKIKLTRKDNPPQRFKVSEVLRFIPDKDDQLDLTVKTRTVGEIGIVEPYLGIAVEWKEMGDTWPMDFKHPVIEQASKDEGSADAHTSEKGHTLGASPLKMLPFSRRRLSDEKNIFESDDESPRSVTLHSRAVLGPALPGSYPRSLSPIQRSSSAERYGERNKISFNSRVSNVHRVERIRGTTGLSNLGRPLNFKVNCRQYLLHECCVAMSRSL